MNMFIKLLIHSLKTIDGKKDSALGLKRLMVKQRVDAFKNRVNTPKDNEFLVEEVISKEIDHHIMSRTFFNYRLIRIRAKISYEAFLKQMTVMEMFCYQILDTFTLYHAQETKFVKNMHKAFSTTKFLSFHACLSFLMEVNIDIKAFYANEISPVEAM